MVGMMVLLKVVLTVDVRESVMVRESVGWKVGWTVDAMELQTASLRVGNQAAEMAE